MCGIDDISVSTPDVSKRTYDLKTIDNASAKRQKVEQITREIDMRTADKVLQSALEACEGM